MKLLVGILEADSLHILDSIREVSFDRSMVDLQKIRPAVRYMLRFNQDQYVRFHSYKNKLKEPTLIH